MRFRPLLLSRTARNYDEMFVALYKAMETQIDNPNAELTKDLNAKDGAGVAERQLADVKRIAREEIQWAKNAFQPHGRAMMEDPREDGSERELRTNSDWTTWWLRWVRLCLEKMYMPEMFKEDIQWMMAKNPDAGLSAVPDGVGRLRQYHRKLEHSFALPIAAIYKVRPGYQSLWEAISTLEKIETQWAEDRRHIVEPKPGDEIIINFGDGWAWWKLSRGTCREEADAMGHCGNAGGHYSDRILSLRQKKGKTQWEPHLTFILSEGGKIGEMKGRNNEKPKPKYFPYIIRLLENPIITGIKGGGYKPENNFALKDLTEEQRDALFAVKPELMGLGEYYRLHGVDDKFPEMAVDQVKALDEGYGYLTKHIAWDAENNRLILQKMDNLKELLDEHGNDTAKWVLSVFNGEEDLDDNTSTTEDAQSMINDVLSDDEVTMLGRILIKKYPDDIHELMENEGLDPDEDEFEFEDGDAIVAFAEEMDDPIFEALWHSYSDGRRYGTENEMVKALKSSLDDSKWLPENPEGGYWDDPWFLALAPDQVCELVDSGETLDQWSASDEGNLKIETEQPHYGFSDFDEKGAKEAWEEHYDLEHEYGEAFGPEALGQLIEERRLSKFYGKVWEEIGPEVRQHFKGSSPEVLAQFYEAQRAFQRGEREPLVKMVQSFMPEAFQVPAPVAAPEAQPVEVATA